MEEVQEYEIEDLPVIRLFNLRHHAQHLLDHAEARKEILAEFDYKEMMDAARVLHEASPDQEKLLEYAKRMETALAHYQSRLAAMVTVNNVLEKLHEDAVSLLNTNKKMSDRKDKVVYEWFKMFQKRHPSMYKKIGDLLFQQTNGRDQWHVILPGLRTMRKCRVVKK